jgi:hypothetical protein
MISDRLSMLGFFITPSPAWPWLIPPGFFPWTMAWAAWLFVWPPPFPPWFTAARSGTRCMLTNHPRIQKTAHMLVATWNRALAQNTRAQAAAGSGPSLWCAEELTGSSKTMLVRSRDCAPLICVMIETVFLQRIWALPSPVWAWLILGL